LVKFSGGWTIRMQGVTEKRRVVDQMKTGGAHEQHPPLRRRAGAAGFHLQISAKEAARGGAASFRSADQFGMI